MAVPKGNASKYLPGGGASGVSVGESAEGKGTSNGPNTTQRTGPGTGAHTGS